MKKQIFILIIAAVILSSCGKPPAPPPTSTPLPPPTITSTPRIVATNTPLPTVTPVCVSPEPTQQDIDRAHSYTGDAFDSSWDQSEAALEGAYSITWQNIVQGAVAYLEARIKPCGYEEPDLNRDFSEATWSAIFANYESYESIAECKLDSGIRLYQFKTYNLGFEYKINYWVESDTDNRIIVTMIVFPAESQPLLDEYSIRLFPNLPNCS
ncbi:MAG TPA: hypothetical protein PKE35_13800 [Anaerolineales bacterium]|nr:hypothetical protein [Anaerolineales bacterium]HMX75324.1 hypothetical protein [Anaerolineales bacterium]HMZ43116.1 hypothetical protein [Anaerolineales bacterium]HNB87741.1 hypothetical protein [Anaerolineales bacterium]HNC89262.1 hypothetical protein [Anaerolineales bacterium]